MCEYRFDTRKEMDDLLNVVEPTMTALLMSDAAALQVKCNHSTRVINCCLPNVSHITAWKTNRELLFISIPQLRKLLILTHASGALLFMPMPLSLDKKISAWASVKLWCISNAEFSFVRTYWFGDCLFNLAMLFISRWSKGRWERKKDTAFGRRGKLAASWTAIWNSSMVRPPLCLTKINTC